jgi:L-lactate dehydrogenase complex protein LldE
MAHVALFDPCYMATLAPDDAANAKSVLEALGDTVTLIDGRCCGQPAFNSGYRDEARDAGRQLLKAAQPWSTIVIPSGSCCTMVQHFLPALYDGERRLGAQSIGSRFREFGQYVARHPNIDRLGLKLDGVVAYHDACHGRRELGVTEDVIGLLGRIQSLELRRLAHEDECCGFGGTFSVKMPEISVAMMTSKLDDVVSTGARVLVSGDFSCLAHLDAGARGLGLRLETWTLAELLARALG